MTAAADIVFHAPMKPPDHPVPSGDRTMARLLVKALGRAGFNPEIVTRFRSYEKSGDPAAQDTIRQEAEREAERIVTALRKAPALPRLWFSYHVYYKSPDWIGPQVARELGIPYVVAEGSRAMKRANGPWAIGHKGAEQALDAAQAVFAMTERDGEALRRHAPTGQEIVSLPPFLDLDEWPEEPGKAISPGVPVLIAVAMMRPGDKHESYRQLAEALAQIPQLWQLVIVGDGPCRAETEHLFAGLRGQIDWRGEITDKAQLAALYASADLFVWPAVNEAYGMALLEAQAFGCPVVAGHHGGVAAVIRDGETGLLAPKDDTAAFAACITELHDPAMRRAFAANARRFVREERSLGSAAAILAETLHPLIERSGA